MSGFLCQKTVLRTKKELRKNKNDEDEGKTFVFVVLFLVLKEEDAG